MFNGLWTVEFISTLNRFGYGVIVLNSGRLLGGDNGYYYSGNYEIKDNRIQGKVAITRYNPSVISVFGEINNFSLSLTGHITSNSIEAVGSFDMKPNLKIKIICKKKVEL
jgi:hypothetical protein